MTQQICLRVLEGSGAVWVLCGYSDGKGRRAKSDLTFETLAP